MIYRKLGSIILLIAMITSNMVIIASTQQIGQDESISHVKTIADLLNEPYKDNFETGEITDIVDKVNKILLTGNVSETSLEELVAKAEEINQEYRDARPLIIASKYAKILILAISPIILYFSLDAIPCAIYKILMRRRKQ